MDGSADDASDVGVERRTGEDRRRAERRRGGPPLTLGEPSEMLSFRTTRDVIDAVDAAARSARLERSQWLRRLVEGGVQPWLNVIRKSRSERL